MDNKPANLFDAVMQPEKLMQEKPITQEEIKAKADTIAAGIDIDKLKAEIENHIKGALL